MPTWKQSVAAELGSESLAALIRNEIPAIRIGDFASADECAAFTEAVYNSPDLKSYSVATPTHYLGLVMYEYRQGGGRKQEFFDAVPEAVAAQEKLYARSFDVPTRFRHMLSAHHPGGISVPIEPGYGEYCPVVVRIASNGVHLHADYAPYNSPDWEIGAVEAQITWNLYTQCPSEGGETTVYNSPWVPAEGEDPARGLPDASVESDDSIESFTFAPKAGEVVLFNPRNPHKIAAGAAGGEGRVSIGSFLGLKGSDLLMWS
ncbi:2OG-Fe(II)-dependent halogenase WelO5 family protein [Rhodococcus gordoniae]